MAKSYFAILGISTSASSDEVRSAYRRLAKEFHPDHYEGDGALFRQIQEAYSILGDARRRRQYEKSIVKPTMRSTDRRPPCPEPEPLIPEQKTSRQRAADIGDISPIRSFDTFSPSFDEVFDWLWDNFSSLDQPKSGRVQSLTIEVPLTRDQAEDGGNARVMVPARAMCPTCRGYGSVGFYDCIRCAGEWAITGEIPVSISFPPGLTQDHAVVVPLTRFGIRNTQLMVLFRPMEN
jgi:molecular chaperone DnaJ